MKIGVYHQHREDVPGGAEFVVVAIAEALSRSHTVDLLHHRPTLTAGLLESQFGADLHAVRLRYVAPDDDSPELWERPWRRYPRERNRYASFTRDYDLLIASIHDVPPFCHASHGALFVHFPKFDRDTTWPYDAEGHGLRSAVRRAYARWEWKQRFAGYEIAMSNSEFTRDYTRKWWGLDSSVVYAPTRGAFRQAPKSNAILSVGRFASGGTTKNQLELVNTFCDLARDELHGWEYNVVGGLTPSSYADGVYYQQVRAAAARCGVHVAANVRHDERDALYERSRIFWHAAGYGDPHGNPRFKEHFGIVTVEAMAAGCVPVVVASGGQPEIVEHGVSGFLWQRLEELEEYTRRLARDDQLLTRMSKAARERARHFSQEEFVRRVLEALAPALSRPRRRRGAPPAAVALPVR